MDRSTSKELGGRDKLALAALLAFVVVSWQHYVHETLLSRSSEGLAEFLPHMLRDGLLAFPVAYVAVDVGLTLAAGFRSARRSSPLLRAAIITQIFMVGMLVAVPVHGMIDQAFGGHGLEEGPWLIHAVHDSLIGQAMAFPLLLFGIHFLTQPISVSLVSRPRMLRVAVAFAVMAAVVVQPNPLGNIDPAAATGAVTADGCEVGAPERSYDVAAINVDMVLNRFGDHDPTASMYVLESQIPAVRTQERTGEVSPGLRNDAIQALVIRANVGECLIVNFTNRMTNRDATFNVHGLAHTAANSPGNVGNNRAGATEFGQTTTYTFAIPSDPLAEGSYQFHSHVEMRQTLAHGLFGQLVIEPAGSEYFHPEIPGQPLLSGWEAIIVDPFGVDFREFVIMMHEVGDEDFEVLDINDDKLPVIDDEVSGAYRPGSRALNYRSEPFRNRLLLAPEQKSLAYSSYTFGDPATPIPRSYLGEPTKTRLSHPGSEMFHVYHLHGGGDRWRRQPEVESGEFTGGLNKVPTPSATSTRTDSQAVGPGENYNLEHECGAGGCQQAAGDFLFHCHIGQHYVAGMWSFWRVFDTRQADLALMPADAGYVAPPVAEPGNSLSLMGTVVEGKTIVAAIDVDQPDEIAIEEYVADLLPPQGVRIDGEDATVWDWVIDYVGGDLSQPLFMSEPEEVRSWPNYSSPTPGSRRAILFNLDNGRLAWPQFSPHLGKRPPFAGNGHSGAPWLGVDGSATRPDGICPSNEVVPNTRRLQYPITAIDLPIEVAPGAVISDGMLYALNENVEAIRAGVQKAEPLVLRSSVGDCLSLIFTSEQLDANHGGHAKANIHTHFVQFDPQASDGVITGYAYEQSVRPIASENRTLVSAATPGTTTIDVTNVDRLRVGISIGVGLGEGMCDPTSGAPVAVPDNSDRRCTEIRTITAISGTTISLDAPLINIHGVGEAAGVEFAQYIWYSDVDDGTVFFHDHVDFNNWGHGLFGAHIVEPEGSTYHDPVTGAEIRSGTVADIHTPETSSVGAGQSGSFRELVVMVTDQLPLPFPENRTISSLNLRSEPLKDRDSEFPFSSVTNGDPMTPLLRTYLHDDVVLRSLGVMERMGTISVTGHRFQEERFATEARLHDTISIGISEREDLVLESGAGGESGQPGDYLIYNTIAADLEDGAWGLMRVHDTLQSDLRPLPGHAAPPDRAGGFPQQTFTGGAPAVATDPGNPCPAGAPVRRHDVAIFDTLLPFGGIMYALETDQQDIIDGILSPEPLVLRVNEGDCLEIRLRNDLLRRAGLSLSKLLSDPQGSQGASIGFNQDSSVAPGERRTYRFYADKELGTALFTDLAAVEDIALGAFGAVVVEPAGATWRDPTDGSPIESGVSADIIGPTGNFREHVLLMQESDDRIGQSTMPYPTAVEGFAGINYGADPTDPSILGSRINVNPDPALVYDSDTHGDPNTLIRAYVGDPVRLRVGVGAGEGAHVFGLDGHRFAWEPDMAGSQQLSSKAVLPGESFDVHLIDGAGGGAPSAADYLVSDHRMPFMDAGMWGIFRTFDDAQPDLLTLPPQPPGETPGSTSPPAPAPGPPAPVLGVALVDCLSMLTHPFTDVAATSFADDDIACIYNLGVTTGTSATTYSPDRDVTREEMAAFLARLYRVVTGKSCDTTPTPFTDVPASPFASDIVCIYNLRLTTGTSDDTYSPDRDVTREEMAAFLARLYRNLTV